MNTSVIYHDKGCVTDHVNLFIYLCFVDYNATQSDGHFAKRAFMF